MLSIKFQASHGFIVRPCPKIKFQASEMAQHLKVLAAKPNNLSSIPGTYMMEGKN